MPIVVDNHVPWFEQDVAGRTEFWDVKEVHLQHGFYRGICVD